MIDLSTRYIVGSRSWNIHHVWTWFAPINPSCSLSTRILHRKRNLPDYLRVWCIQRKPSVYTGGTRDLICWQSSDPLYTDAFTKHLDALLFSKNKEMCTTHTSRLSPVHIVSDSSYVTSDPSDQSSYTMDVGLLLKQCKTLRLPLNKT